MNRWALLMSMVSLVFVLIAFSRATIVYTLLHARASILWGEHAGVFLKVSSVLCLAASLLWLAGLIWNRP